jgi:hypothetical protein
MVAVAILARAQSGEGEGSQEEDVVRGRLRPE